MDFESLVGHINQVQNVLQAQAAHAVNELKDGPFKTAYLGQLAGYLRILDDEVRKPNENPSIGIVLCKSANKKFVE